MSIEKGVVYVVATPIGNLGDITARAREVLAGVDVIAAEDTRHSARLLRHFGIGTACVALHEHNERELCPRLLGRVQGGDAVALISDAGTPLISDPGYHLVRSARAAGIRVIPVPGPSALISALSVSGLPTDRFVFEGFLPSRSAARTKVLESLASESRTMVFFESPRRLVATLGDMALAFGSARPAVLLRELTKLHETIRGDTLGALSEWVEGDPDQRRGECVLVVAGQAPSEAGQDIGDARRIVRILLTSVSVRQAAQLAAEITGQKKRDLYRLALELEAEAGKDP